ncbi:hypothetical protein PEBR_07514 [Penicillium brasilianum]|uniref:Uncharacterized protein n=1 Tax=Penicillium brasilianum TaxID=104259 RepID=A0A1S9RWC1_PENBI|nr:hypothetical protein PEBR_07514 [Penicillium brasilianum]
MGDAARPSDEDFKQVLQGSLTTWSSYLSTESEDDLLPWHAIDLKALVSQTPPFLGDGIVSSENISFSCEERRYSLGTGTQTGTLLINGQSTWKTSKGNCTLPSRVLPKQLLLAVGSRRNVEFSEDYPLSDWPGVQGLSGYEKGNYISVLYFAWGYILSARWVEALSRSADHDCDLGYNVQGSNSSPPSNEQSKIQIDLGEDASAEEVFWWRNILCSNDGWDASTKYNGLASTGARPKPPSTEREDLIGDPSVSIADLINDLGELLPRFMTLSSNIWGLRSLLSSTFFNPDIDCNLVSAWLNPAFAVLDSIASGKSSLAVPLANGQPRLGILWLGAILMNVAKIVLQDVRSGMMALDIPASAWTGTTQTFLTLGIGSSHGESIRRDDECRLLFITACEYHERPPVWVWKPFGCTKLCDTELPVEEHAQCASHCLEYECWEWILAKNGSIRDSVPESTLSPVQKSSSLVNVNRSSARLDDYDYDFHSESLSEGYTSGTFRWLRSTGYPRNERPIYKHSWLDLESPDEEDDSESDVDEQSSSKREHVESWLKSME